MFRLNIALAIVWMALLGEFTVESFVEGFLMVLITLSITQVARGESSYFHRARVFITFILYFLWEMIVASFRIAFTVLWPWLRIRPAVVAIPLDLETDDEVTLLANLITLTPGTLSLDVSNDRKTLYVHAFDVKDVPAFRQQIKSGFERRVREVMQWQR